MIREKTKLRLQFLQKLRKQKEVSRLKKSFKIYQKLFALKEFVEAKLILFYLSFGGEVETFMMVDKAVSLGKKVVVPVIERKDAQLIPFLAQDYRQDLEIGPYGIYQPKRSFRYPVSLEEIDLVIVPGVAFDLKGNRLGRGAGYYDRFLKKMPKNILSIGLAFDFQVVDKLYHLEPHDAPITKVLFA